MALKMGRVPRGRVSGIAACEKLLTLPLASIVALSYPLICGHV
jgi:hypothetical protein